MESGSSLNSIEQLITKLANKLDLTGEQIADVLWLTLELQKIEVSPSEEKLQLPESAPNKSLESSNQKNNQPSTPTGSRRTPGFTEKQASVYFASDSRDSLGDSKSLTIDIPDAPSLRESLKLAQALRPLMRRVATGRKLVLDEAATVQRIAEECIVIPVLQAEPEPWLDLALVIDESQSMLIWGHTILELKDLLKKYGIFRYIKICGLQPDESGNNLQFFLRMGSNKRLTEPKEIIDPTGRCLILIVSDCVSNIWRKGMMFPVLKAWTQKQPVVILQMLPEWMWRRTALDLGTAVGFKSSIIGAANQELSLDKPLRRSRSIGFKVEERSKIPVITLELGKVAQWSQMLVGKADALVPGYLLPPELKSEEEFEYPLLEREENTRSAEIVKHFRMTTSPLGRELAGLLAVSPVINLPVVRLIQESLLSKSNQVQVAEVFLGGLLRPKLASLEKIENQVAVNPDLIEYEFIDPGIQDIFLDDAPVSDSIDVINAVSLYVAEQLGVSLRDFKAILKAPHKKEKQQREDTIKPFARITARVLRKLGGEYVKFAEELEQAGKGYREEYGVELEMVAIPGGSFLMGSPDGEGYDEEHPQHRVKVPSFYMGKYPVTNAQWKAVMGTEPASKYDAKFRGSNQPVIAVSWDDAQEYCQKLSSSSGRKYRLPSEAEWEYACRAGTTTPFYFGENISTEQVNYDGNYPYKNAAKGEYREKTTEVGRFPANSFGLYDIHGNVWEWCEDEWHENYDGAPEDGSAWVNKNENNSQYRLLRGGSWFNNAYNCRSAVRIRFDADNGNDAFGFRVVCS